MAFLRTAAALAGAVLIVCATAIAQVESTPVPAAAKPDFSKMMFLTGNWNCSVKSSRRPGPYQTTSTATMSPDGYWLVTKTMIHKNSWIPATFSSEDKMTYDASTSKWVDLSTDTGGGYDVSTSPGWSGDSITWTDMLYPKANATAISNPTTMTKVSDTKTTSKSTFREPSGRLITVNTTCMKAR